MQNLTKFFTFLIVLAVFAGLIATSGTASAQEPTPIPPVKANKDWTPVERDFDGVTMVLVPSGCFMMGSTEEQIAALNKQAGADLVTHEGPVHEICFDQPFWIDKYEVTNEQFAKVGGKAGRQSNWTSEKRPRERITWFEARDFCKLRGARLPTEAEWEYAARGPDGLVYPWGNDFVAENVVYYGNSNGFTAHVGSKPGGVSWVGALDLSGNVWEWVNSLDLTYPYKVNDGRETNSNLNTPRVLRGGCQCTTDTYVRTAFRVGEDPSLVNDNYGFRCARPY